MNVAGNLFIIIAPSGAGKTTLVNALLKKISNLVLSISHTTRPRRSREKPDTNYFFVDEDTFKSMIEEDAFLEHAKVFSHYYGTSRKWVEQELAQGVDVILEIDWQGAVQIKKLYPDCVSIFILPPSINALQERLHRRKQDTKEVIDNRLREAKIEMSHCHEFDYLVVNQRFNTALIQLRAIITAERIRTARQCKKQKELIARLLD
ncbi:MAG: guanylate kinase [Coxiellaceae bacterium]|nr:guanylate kinase [Coxiellaceae bacterium]